MKIFNSSLLFFLAVFHLCLGLSSCNSNSKPDLKQGLKLTILINNKKAIDNLANCSDVIFTNALNNADSKGKSNRQLVNDFIRHYKTLKHTKPLSNFFYSADGKGFRSDEALGSFLIAALDIENKKMNRVLKNRIKAFCNVDTGIIKIEYQADNRMLIYIPGITNKADLKPIFSSRDGLHFWETYDLSTLTSSLTKLDEALMQEQKQPKTDTRDESLQEIVAKGEKNRESSLFSKLIPNVDVSGNPNEGAIIGLANFKDTADIMRMLNGNLSKTIMPSNICWIWGDISGYKMEEAVGLYAIRLPEAGRSTISSDDVAEAKGDYYNGKPEIMITMTQMGAIKWQRMTKANIGKSIAMELNHYIYSAPTVRGEITGGRSSITGTFSAKQMADLVKILNSGSYPLPFKVIRIESYYN